MAIGNFFLPAAISSILSFGTTNIPLIGLILMMYPPLAKVKYEQMGQVFKDTKVLGASLFLNWVLGPILMFALALIFLNGYPEYMIGVILIGLARCIAMVVVWNDLADGNRNMLRTDCLKQYFQVLLYSICMFLLRFFLPTLVIPVLMSISVLAKSESVGIYLGIPFALGIISRYFNPFKRRRLVSE
jgi:ACR3 family arsenite transporter